MVNPRGIAAEALYLVIYKGKSLTGVLQRPAITKLPDESRALVKDLCFGCLRWHFALQQILEKILVKPMKKKDKDIECLIRVGLYQLQYQHTADHAAVNETVKACKTLKKPWSKGLVNGVLRRFQRDRETLTSKIKPHTVFPLWIIQTVKQSWPTCWKEVLIASNQRAPMTLRLNTARTHRDDYMQQLESVGIKAIPHTVVKTAIELVNPVNVQQLPGFDTGLVSVQDASAQLAAPLLNIKPGMRVLDACAAPGGKTGHILESEEDIVVTAIDNSAQRLGKVAENIQRLGFDNNPQGGHIQLVEADAGELDFWYDGKSYDRILLDAPCSALGVMRRHPDIKVLRKETDIAALVKQQQHLLERLWHVLKEGGLLLYATCSILPQENDEQIAHFLDKHKEDAEVVPIQQEWGIACTHGRQILPGSGAAGGDNMDGFYYCLLKKLAVSS